MRLISFDALRSWDIPEVRTVKPAHWFREKERIRQADWVLFPEYWQVNTLVYGWKKRIFPSISTYHIGHDKVEMFRAFEGVCPSNIPLTLILPKTDTAIETVLDTFDFPFVAKTVRSARGEGVFLIGSRPELLDYAARHETLFMQEYLPANRDLRVVVIGRQVVAAYWREAPAGTFHNNISRGGTVSFDDIPTAALTLVRQVAAELGIDHAGFDVIVSDDGCYLLEFNLWFGTSALNDRGIRTGGVIRHYLDGMTRSPREPDDYPRLPKAG
ncbi:MAG: hypothetical protein SWH68_14580 [Thermodesulfobacteriota bacterium]|nr:hypothetical protein [Thermodesulfobacteriota bacterium]